MTDPLNPKWETIRATYKGEKLSLAHWPPGSPDETKEARRLAKRAVSILENFDDRRDFIEADKRLSDEGKKEDVRAVGVEALSTLRTVQKMLDTEREEAEGLASSLSAVEPYRDGDVATVLIDLALAEQLRAMDSKTRLARLGDSGDRRIAEAALRLPGALTGVSDRMRDQVARRELYRSNPKDVAGLEARQDGVRRAQGAVTTAYNTIFKDIGLGIAEAATLAGEHAASLTGAPDLVARLERAGRLGKPESEGEVA